jgi:hypothetical protein
MEFVLYISNYYSVFLKQYIENNIPVTGWSSGDCLHFNLHLIITNSMELRLLERPQVV